jgi:hypothetical protein
LKCLKKKLWANFQRIIELFTQKIVTMLSKVCVWDPRFGIRKKTYSGSRIQGSKRHRIPDPDPQRWYYFLLVQGDLAQRVMATNNGAYSFLLRLAGSGEGDISRPVRRAAVAALTAVMDTNPDYLETQGVRKGGGRVEGKLT